MVARAAFAYFLGVFALGFVLGAFRTLWLAPRIGATAAVLCELPIMLAASWWLAARIVRVRRLRPCPAFATGTFAFALLMGAEALLATALAGRSLGQWAADLARTPGWIGLAGQIAFGMFPWLAARRSSAR